MKATVIKFLLITFSIHLSCCLEAHFGSCPTVRSIELTFKDKLAGTWYDILKYQSIFIRGKCMSFDVKESAINEVIITSNEYYDGESVNSTRNGKVYNDGSFEFDFTFLKFSARFYILDADHRSYLVGFACKNVAYMMNLQMVFVWGREKELTQEQVARVYEVLKKYKISTTELEKSEQVNCH